MMLITISSSSHTKYGHCLFAMGIIALCFFYYFVIHFNFFFFFRDNTELSVCVCVYLSRWRHLCHLRLNYIQRVLSWTPYMYIWYVYVSLWNLLLHQFISLKINIFAELMLSVVQWQRAISTGEWLFFVFCSLSRLYFNTWRAFVSVVAQHETVSFYCLVRCLRFAWAFLYFLVYLSESY